MQIDRKLYDPALHDIYKALTVKQPFADLLTKMVGRDEDGNPIAEKTIELRPRKTNYRGELLICSSKNPVIPGHESACTCGLVELYDCIPVEEFTEQDWRATCIPSEQRGNWKKCYGWKLRHPRRVVEMPVKGQLGIYDLVVPKDDITEYPTRIVL